MRMFPAPLTITHSTLITRVLLVLLAACIGLSAPMSASAQTLRGTAFTTESGDHSLEWNESWEASLSAEDDFSTMVMLEAQIMIYAVMFIHDEDLGLSERAVYGSLSGVLVNSFDAPPVHSVEWEGDDGIYRGAHILQLSGIDFVLYLRVDPAVPGSGPSMQFAAAPSRAFPLSLQDMQTDLLVDGLPVFAGDDGNDVMDRLSTESSEQDAPADLAESESEAAPAPQSSDRARPIDDRSRLQRDAHIPARQTSGSMYTSNANGFTVTYPETWADMALSDATIGEFSLSSESGRSVVSFTGRSTTETNRQAFFEDIAARESRYSGFVGSVISDDRLLIATWTDDNELAVLEYVFVDDTTVVTIMVTITSGNPDRYVADVQGIELDDQPILRDWDELWPGDE